MSPPSSVLASTRVLLAGDPEWMPAVTDLLESRVGAVVRTEPTVDGALDAVRSGVVDCVVTGYEFPSATGIGLVESIRDETATLPVVLCTAAGSEAIASDAIAAGATDYVPLGNSGGGEDGLEDLLERTERSVRSARRVRTRRDRARQFDAIFHDARTATWVLDPDGALARVNETAREMIAADVETLVGDPFWTLPWWRETEGLSADVRRLTERALEGTFGRAVLLGSAAVEDPDVLELSAHPVWDEHGELVSIVVEGVDISDRVHLERDLRQSEALHRVTLNNMTDTVLITNEAGEYTYVCPNVHFIFGYTAAEIRKLGTIEELLGEDLFDRAELEREGVLKNIECTATDKAGREHTLLVNVREVSIQDGTLLYSCRDVTTRKQREEALATLQETARDFLYAETTHEIARHIVEDTPSVLDVEASAVYHFDPDETELGPVAHSPSMERLNGPLPTVHADASSLPGYSFLEDESLFFADVHDAERLEDHATDVRSAAYIPLGDHGVYVAGSAEVDRFDAVTRELADLLAATAEAALDRVDRESKLREQDRQLQERNRQLAALNRMNEIIREIDQALVQAETPGEIDHAVCELLTSDDRFRFAWIGGVDPLTDTLEPRAWAGTEEGYLDDVPIALEASDGEPAGRTAATGDVTTVPNVAAGLRAEPWRKAAVARDFLSVLSVPLAYDEFSYGVLTVYANTREAFDETSRAVLAELGETIASATSGIERKNALLTPSVTRFEFAVEDPTFVLSRLARDADCTIAYRGGVQQTDVGSAIFVSVEGADPAAVERATAALHAVEDVQRLTADGTGGVLRLRLARPFLALELADHGAVLRRATVDASGTVLVVDVPDSVDARPVTELVAEAFTSVELRSKRTLDRSETRDSSGPFLDRLTDRQLEVLQTAYYSGFFESPRESTGEEVAAALDISPAAFYQHARTVQRKLFSTLFDELGVPAPPAAE